MRKSRFLCIPSLITLAALSACGGGSDDTASTASAQATTAIATVTVAATLDSPDSPDAAALAALAGIEASPSFHAAALALDEPENGASPHRQAAAADLASLPTRGLTIDGIDAALQRRRALAGAGGEASPLAATSTVTTYTPAQIRAAYGLPALPPAAASLTAAQAAQLGAGQTIYLVNAKHNPNTAAELAAFNSKFGLPGCSTRTLSASSTLPLAAAAGSACELVVAYATSAGGLSSTAPAYDSGWATEIALDVQWAHATAPLARLVLIEAPDPGVTSLSNAVALANKMGAGVVSMSFGAAEGNWTSSVDGVFSGSGMSYAAATGDNGAAVSWPAVSTRVLAVSGTTLSYTGSGARSETVWTGSGGGVSAFTAAPAYQANLVSGVTQRAVADVAFNADPNTGQYVATLPAGATTVRWISAGGTSLSTPQWAGLLAVANALRANAAKAALGTPHGALYAQVAAVPGTYAAAFADIKTGSNGACATCTAKTGYDTASGWGTPNAGALLTALTGASVSTSAPAPAPAVGLSITTPSLTGSAGKALSGTVGVSAPGASSWTGQISGAPAGMSFGANSGGVAVTWAKPVAGSYTLNLSIKDNLGRTASGKVAVTIVK